MSVTYRAVGWNPHKIRYDVIVVAAALLAASAFVAASAALRPELTVETLLIRAFGVTAFALLHVILSIGPLVRLDRRFVPLLYNRRHLGVTTFGFALAHGTFALVQFHALGNVPPLVSLLTTSPDVTAVSRFPFQVLGAGALVVLFLMAATSHDFWLRALTPPVWKSLHMCVYGAYVLLVAHVALGALQSDPSGVFPLLVAAGGVWLVTLHLAAAARERRLDRITAAGASGLVDVCAVSDVPEGRARIVCASGERIAVFRYDDKLSAVSNVCQHQNGPLGEGRIVNGCIVCPWHGYEYAPDSGCAPPPFTEKVPTFTVLVSSGRVLIDPRPHPPGTRVEPARVGEP